MPDDADTEFHRTVFSAPNPSASPARPSRLPVLVVLRGAQVGRRYLLNENGLVLGRRPDRADLVVPGDPQISSVHCRVERGPQPDTWQVVDLSSTNGTVIDGNRITTMTLRDGDRLHLGTTVLKFCYHDELEEEFHRQVDHLMNIDDLTGLPVQRVFQTRFVETLLACARRHQPMAVYMMDMDGLKRINDTHGHLLGAHTIATVGKRLGQIVQQAGGVVSRFGGDEFSAFVPNLDREAGLALGETMRCAVADEAITRGTVMATPTISIGYASFPDDGQLAEQLTRQADEALYRAKNAGRNRVSV
ncbi:MAG: GGDEF domain-containing protein [Planctomycetes bacterium]|nr:GGDEF domain-containing protein [Planctomycetota bacterium]